MKKILSILPTLLFVCGIAIGIFGRVICIRHTRNYQELQPELFAPEIIDTVLYDEDLKQLYVCYNDASYVNVYTDSGEFLWAVSTPYLRNSHFVLQDENLIIYNDKAYVYNSADGSFIECVNVDDLQFDHDYYTKEDEWTDDFEAGEIYYDTYQVYKARSDGSLETIISRPGWYWCFNFALDLCIAFTGAIVFGISIFIEKKKDYNTVRKEINFTNRKSKLIFNYFRITSAVHIVYFVLDIIFGFYGGILCIGIMPLAIHFIISNIIFWNMLDRISATREEMIALDYWKTVEIASFIIAFISVIIAASIAAA